MQVRDSRASSVVVHRVPAESAERFLAWQRGVTEATSRFTGYQSTDVYPPASPDQLEWVVVIQFANPAGLEAWLDSPVRAEWTAKLPADVADFKLKTLPTGFGPWFAGLVGGDEPHPPGWKMALTVLLGLYPTVMLLSLFVGPHTTRFGFAISLLIGNALSTVALQWLVVPALMSVLGPWLKASGARGRALSSIGALAILVTLTILAIVFRWIAG